MATKVHAAQQLFLITAVLILCNWQQAQANQTVYVDSTEQCQDDYQCNNFTYFLNTSTIFTSNTTIFFLRGRHFITASLTVSNITNLVLRGPEVSPDKPPAAHIVITGEAFHFENVSKLAFQYLNITFEQYNALQFRNIYYMLMDKVHIFESRGYGLYAHNIFEDFSIRNCKFLSNKKPDSEDDGGNAKITYDGFNDTKHNILQISHSEFGYGRSALSDSSTGGLYIEVISTVGIEQYYLSISVSDCTFHNNIALKGANMRISYPQLNAACRHLVSTISIVNCLFINGRADQNGGGLNLRYIGSDNSTANVCIYNSTFLGNVAVVGRGGGLSMRAQSQQFLADIIMSKFIDNEVKVTRAGQGGGGVYIELTKLSSPLPNVTKIVVYNTTFERNRAFHMYASKQYGGGLYLVFGDMDYVEIRFCRFEDNIAYSGSAIGIISSPSTAVVIEECSFVNGAAERGGAVSFLIEDEYGPISPQFMTMSDSVFLNNSANLGGAVYLGNSSPFVSWSTLSFLMLKGNSFYDNNAMYGGVLYVDGRMRGELDIVVDQCVISNNYANTGSVLNIILHSYATSINTLITECQIQHNRAEASVINITNSNIYTQSLSVHFTNSQFLNNIVTHIKYKTSTIVYLQHVFKCHISRTNFSGNSGNSLLANNSHISLQGNVVFSDNTAFAGAAVLLDCPPDSLQPSFLNLLPNSTVIITNNTALHSGGGIAVNPDCKYDYRCFFQSPSLSGDNYVVDVDSNSAGILGNSIYGPPIKYCMVAENTSGIEAFPVLFNVVQNAQDDIVFAENYELCFCGVKQLTCVTHSQVEVRPGQEFNVSIMVTRPFQDLSSISFIRSNLTTKSAYLGELQDIQELRSVCGNLTFSVTAPTSMTAQIKLSIEFAPTTHHSFINVTVLDCPAGFQLDDDFVCDCDPYLTSTIQGITCDINTNTLTIPGKVWIGNYTNYKLLAHPYCPLGYCNPQTHSLDLQNQDEQCTSNRSDILCGACRKGFSLTLGTVNCLDNCSHYYLFLIIPFALAGVLFVVILLKCNLTVSTGTVNALIFYANIIHVNSTIFFPRSKTILLTQFLSVFLAWINLDLGIETCFYKGMNAYANTWLQFVFPVYIWILVLIMIYSSRYYVNASKLIGRNAVSVLATLFLLSYAKLLRTIIAAVSSIRVRDEDGTSHLLWLIDGNVPYFSGPHIALFIMAVLAVLLYIIPLTLLTLLAPCLQARTNHRMMRWVVRIKPLLDAFLGPYKDKYRYWTGVMLIVRLILFTVFAANTLGDPNVNLFAIILLMLLTGMFLTYKSSVYRSRINLILECFFNFNLCIFSTATLSLTSSERSSEYLACVMVGSSFIVFCCIVVWHFNQQTNLISRAFDKIKAMRRLRAGGDGEQQATDPPPPPQRQAQPTVSVIDMKELRESVLTNN